MNKIQGVIARAIGVQTKPAIVVIGQPAKVSRARKEQRLARVEASIQSLTNRQKAADKVARLEAEATYLRDELGL